MPHETIVLIGADAELWTWLNDRVLQPAGYTVVEASDLASGRAQVAAHTPHLLLIVLSAQSADELALVAEFEPTLPSVVIAPQPSLEVWETAMTHGASDVLARPLDAARVLTAVARGVRRGRVQREHTTLREQTDRQSQEFNALYTVGQKVAALFDIEEILKLVVTAAVNLMQAEEGTLMLLDVKSGELYLRASCSSYEDVVHNLRVKVTDSLMGRVLQSGRPIMLERADLLKIRTALLVAALVSVPLSVGGHVIGVLSVYNRQAGRRFREHDVHLLLTLADFAAIAIRNAELYHDVRRTADRFAALAEIDRRISESLDRQTVLERITAYAKELLLADDSEVYLLDREHQTLQAIAAVGEYAAEIKASVLQVGQGVVGFVAQSGVAEMVNAIEADPRHVNIPGTPEVHEALLCAPLMSQGEILGVMVVARIGDRPPFEGIDFEFFMTLTAQAVIAIENARLYAVERQRAVELSQALAQQQELDKLKNTFIQNVSHELRTPLAIIRGYAELMLAGDLGELAETQLAAVAIMARRARMLNKMLDDLLTILAAETQKFDKEPVDLGYLTQLVITDFQAPAKLAGLSLRAAIQPQMPKIYADVTHLRRVLDNLLGNALKFTPAGGKISVTLSRIDSHVVLEVSDTGIGIAADQLGKIFQRFYQVDGSSKRRFGGVGLGLALVKEIVEAHEGTVEVTSAVGEGTTFRIALPVWVEEQTSAETT